MLRSSRSEARTRVFVRSSTRTSSGARCANRRRPPRAGTVSFFTTGSIDTYGYLLNSSGAEITHDDDSNGNNQFIITTYLNPGTYYLKVKGYSSGTTGAYRVYAN